MTTNTIAVTRYTKDVQYTCCYMMLSSLWRLEIENYSDDPLFLAGGEEQIF